MAKQIIRSIRKGSAQWNEDVYKRQAEINERVYEYSLNKFGRPLCIKCQRGGNK